MVRDQLAQEVAGGDTGAGAHSVAEVSDAARYGRAVLVRHAHERTPASTVPSKRSVPAALPQHEREAAERPEPDGVCHARGSVSRARLLTGREEACSHAHAQAGDRAAGDGEGEVPEADVARARVGELASHVSFTQFCQNACRALRTMPASAL